MGRVQLGGKTKLNAERKKVESVRSHVVLLETDAGHGMELYLVSHSHMAIHKLMEMG